MVHMLSIPYLFLYKEKETSNNNHWWHYASSVACNYRKKWNLIQKPPSCKKSALPPRRPFWKKMWNPRWQPRNVCDGRLIAKILRTTIQVNLVPHPNEMWRSQHKLTVLKIFPVNLRTITAILHHHHGFHSCFCNGLFWGHPLFYNWITLLSL